jgi:hypothetical protein
MKPIMSAAPSKSATQSEALHKPIRHMHAAVFQSTRRTDCEEKRDPSEYETGIDLNWSLTEPAD